MLQSLLEPVEIVIDGGNGLLVILLSVVGHTTVVVFAVQFVLLGVLEGHRGYLLATVALVS